MNKNQALHILMVGMTLGTAWAVRGHFGHEQGAAWAGGIATLGLILVSRRKDWYSKMLPTVLAASVGWGITGMISYGLVVGYGMSNNYPNALYGLTMLFAIGTLFGVLGGGLTGLSLESSKERKVEWGVLFAQMGMGGLIVYGLLIQQLEWLMTPPRSEAWAICLGAALALLWYTARKGFPATTRISLITGIGTGFGFAFGNFLQIVGMVAEIPFNMWNVMEYSIGFFGGIALAYGIFTSVWPQTVSPVKAWENRVAFVLVFLVIPFVVFQQSLSFDPVIERFRTGAEVVQPELTGKISSISSLIILVISAALIGYRLKKVHTGFNVGDIRFVFIVYFSVYILFGYIINGVMSGKAALNIHLYVVNLIVILMLTRIQGSPFSSHPLLQVDSRKLFKVLVAVILFITVMSFIAVNLHEGLPGTQNRF